jgi:uncharacterized metal-binding protein YceD (DUF177 family)
VFLLLFGEVRRLYIRTSEISREGLDVVASRGKAWIPRLLEGMNTYPFRACRMIAITLFLSLEGRDLEASGSFVAEGEGQCDRCAESVTRRLERQFQTVFVPADRGPVEAGDLELRMDDLDIAFYDGAGIEVADIFWEQVALALPTKVLCREDCRGVCPHCGGDRNRTECDCAGERREGPFDVLKTLRREKE